MEWSWCSCGFDRGAQRAPSREVGAGGAKPGHTQTGEPQEQPQRGAQRRPRTRRQQAPSRDAPRAQSSKKAAQQWSAAQLAVIQRAGMATFEEASRHVDLHRIPREDEPALLAAYGLDIHSRMKDRVSIISSKERVGDDCDADYAILSSLCFVRMLLKPMRSQIQDCKSTLTTAEDELRRLLANKKNLIEQEARQRQVIAYYRQLLSELEQLRGEGEYMADGEGTDDTNRPRTYTTDSRHTPGSHSCRLSTPSERTPILGYRTPRRPASGGPQGTGAKSSAPAPTDRGTAMEIDPKQRAPHMQAAGSTPPPQTFSQLPHGALNPRLQRSSSFRRPTEALMSAPAPLPVGLVASAVADHAPRPAVAAQLAAGTSAALLEPQSGPPAPAYAQPAAAPHSEATASRWLEGQAQLAAMQHLVAERAAAAHAAAPLPTAAALPPHSAVPPQHLVTACAQADIVAKAIQEAEHMRKATRDAERDATLAAEHEHAAAVARDMRRQGEIEMAALAEADRREQERGQNGLHTGWLGLGKPSGAARGFSPYPREREAPHRRRESPPPPTATTVAAPAPQQDQPAAQPLGAVPAQQQYQPVAPPPLHQHPLGGDANRHAERAAQSGGPPAPADASCTAQHPVADLVEGELAKLDATPLTEAEYEQCMRDVFLQQEAEIAEQDADFARRVQFEDSLMSSEERVADQAALGPAAFPTAAHYPASLLQAAPRPPGRFTPATGDFYENWYAERLTQHSAARPTGVHLAGHTGNWFPSGAWENTSASGQLGQPDSRTVGPLDDCWTDDAEWTAKGPQGCSRRESPVRAHNLATTFDAAAQDAYPPSQTQVPTSQLTPGIMRRHIGGEESPPAGEAEVDAYEREYMNTGSIQAAKNHLDDVLLKHQREVAAQLAGSSDTDDALDELPNAQPDGRESQPPLPSPPPAAFELDGLVDLSSQLTPAGPPVAQPTPQTQPVVTENRQEGTGAGIPASQSDTGSLMDAPPPPPPPLATPSQPITPTVPYEPQQTTPVKDGSQHVPGSPESASGGHTDGTTGSGVSVASALLAPPARKRLTPPSGASSSSRSASALQAFPFRNRCQGSAERGEGGGGH